MNKKLAALLMCLVMLAALLPVGASADTGPKPSVTVRFSGLGDEPCYATLMSERESTGPAHVWDGVEGNEQIIDVGRDIWRAFVDYKDPDGFFFLQEAWQVNETKEFCWGYYPPDVFKVLLYFPESGRFISTAILESYAFDSYYSVNVSDSSGGLMPAVEDYDTSHEAWGLIARAIITVATELGIALLFRYGGKKQLIFLAAVNVVTQVILNVIVNSVSFHSGPWAATITLIFGELVVLTVEATAYGLFLNKLGTRERRNAVAVLYAIVANTASLVVGRLLMQYLPGIF